MSYQEAIRERRKCPFAGPNDSSRQRAEDGFRRAAHREPGNLVPRVALAAQLTANGKHDEAIQLYDEIVKLYPDLIEPRYRLEAGKSMHCVSGCQSFGDPYLDVQRRLSAKHCLWMWLRHRDERGYWTVWAPWRAPWRCERLRLKRVVDLAQSCRRMLSLVGHVTPSTEELVKQIKPFNPTVQPAEVEKLIEVVDDQRRREQAEKLIRKLDHCVHEDQVEKLIAQVDAAAAAPALA